MKRLPFGAVAALAIAAAGCGDGGRVKEESIEVQQNSPLDQAKKILENYAKGQAVGSEATSFAKLVEDVRKTDPDRADILEKGFADLQKPKANTVAKSKELLQKLAPSRLSEELAGC